MVKAKSMLVSSVCTWILSCIHSVVIAGIMADNLKFLIAAVVEGLQFNGTEAIILLVHPCQLYGMLVGGVAACLCHS